MTVEAVRELAAVLGGGEVTRIVGGAVRDGLLGLPVSDIDMATRLLPAEVVARLEAAGIKAVPTGIAHGTVTAVLATGPVEVTTLRRDVSTDGRHAVVAFTDDWREDAGRRDFTINALSQDPESGEIFDYFGGRADLTAGCVAFIGDPLARIAEDHLRILRFFRFYARFGRGAPDAAGYAACIARANDLMALSRERIATELLKLLGSEAPLRSVVAMLDGGVFTPVLPKIERTGAVRLEQLIAREAENEISGDPVRRLAALIGPDAGLAAAIAARLKLSKVKAKRLAIASGWLQTSGSATSLAYWYGKESAIDLLLLADGDAAALREVGEWERPKLAITGGGLIARGLPAGPVVAATLARIECDWVASGFCEGAELEAIVRKAIDTIGSSD